MAALRKINERNQITLPPDVLREAGLAQGELVAIMACDGKIILEPKRLAEDDALSAKDWLALDRLVKRQVKANQFTEYANPRLARAHLRRRRP